MARSRYRISSLPPVKGFTAEGKVIYDPPDYLARARREIELWERMRRGALSQFGDFAFSPAAAAGEIVIPLWLREAAALAIEQALRIAAYAGRLSVDEKSVVAEHHHILREEESLADRLKACDGLAKKFWGLHCKYAAAEGAATGLAGLPGFLADIPLILSLVIREIRLIGLSYGYPVTSSSEIDYVIHVLRIATSSDEELKLSSLAATKQLENRAQSGKRLFRNKEEREAGRVKYLLSLQEYSRALAMQFIRRGVLQFIPFAGVVVGASFNASYANDVGRAAYMSYRRRFLEDHK